MSTRDRPRDPAESARLRVLREHAILDTPAEEAFDHVVSLAASLTRSPIALVSLVDEARQWFKARVGLTLPETPREHSFCAHAIADPSVPLVVSDARADPRFADNPLVTGDPGIRFYMGVPVRSAESLALGTLCVIDREPRTPTDEEIESLVGLARQVEIELALRRALARLAGPASPVLPIVDAAGGLVVHSPDIVTILDPAGTIVFESPSVAVVLGHAPDALVGQPAFDFVHAEDRAAVLEAFSRAVTRVGHVERLEFRFRHRDGSFRLLESVAKTLGEGAAVTGVLVHSRDVTLRARAEAEVRLAAAEARLAAGRMTELAETRAAQLLSQIELQRRRERLAALVVHDLKSPLTVMAANVRMLLERHDLPADVRESLADVGACTGRLGRMVRDVLDVSLGSERALVPRRGPVALTALLLEVARHVRPRLAEKRQTLALSLGLAGDLVDADRDLLFRLFENLLDNAHRHSPAGGTIALAARDANPGQIEVDVVDCGPGVPEADRRRLFQVDAWTDAAPPRGAGAGHGLGLVLCRLVAEAHAGAVGCEPHAPRGARFWVRLPRP